MKNYIMQNIKLNSMRPFNNGIIQTMGIIPVCLILVAKLQLMVVDKMLKCSNPIGKGNVHGAIHCGGGGGRLSTKCPKSCLVDAKLSLDFILVITL